MRKLIAVLIVALWCVPALAGDITERGMSQGDMYQFMSNTVTIVNELKDDVDALKLTIVELLEKLDADTGVNSTNYNSTLGLGGNATANSIVPAAVSASDLSLTGL